VDLTVDMAAEYGVRVDREGFAEAMAEQKARSRKGTKADLARHAELGDLYQEIQRRAGETRFLGYEGTEAEGRVVAIVRDGMEFEELTGQGEAEVILDATPFYGEAAGKSATAANSSRPAAEASSSPSKTPRSRSPG